jgi:2-iminobutanoate/2-iminopropanoate deaminase
LFVSGQHISGEAIGSSGEPLSIEQETRAVMERIRSIVEGERLTMTNIVSATIYLSDLESLSEVASVYESYFRSGRPSLSVVEVRRLPAMARVQISVVAGR